MAGTDVSAAREGLVAVLPSILQHKLHKILHIYYTSMATETVKNLQGNEPAKPSI